MATATPSKAVKGGFMPPSLPPNTAWIRRLAEPYLRGYRPRAQSRGPLRGYWFLAPRANSQTGFFVGFLVNARGFSFLMPLVPECLIFSFVRPVGCAAHLRLVARRGALLPKTFEYIRWLTHRPPRFEFHERQLTAMVRNTSMSDWPSRKQAHLSRNFFIETLAWLVRSGLVRKLSAVGDLPSVRRAN